MNNHSKSEHLFGILMLAPLHPPRGAWCSSAPPPVPPPLQAVLGALLTILPVSLPRGLSPDLCSAELANCRSGSFLRHVRLTCAASAAADDDRPRRLNGRIVAVSRVNST